MAILEDVEVEVFLKVVQFAYTGGYPVLHPDSSVPSLAEQRNSTEPLECLTRGTWSLWYNGAPSSFIYLLTSIAAMDWRSLCLPVTRNQMLFYIQTRQGDALMAQALLLKAGTLNFWQTFRMMQEYS